MDSWMRGIKIGLTIIGTTIGAGFASGREIWEFFGSYGAKSQYGILLAMALFGLCSIIILWLSWQKQTDNYFQLMEYLMGKRLAKVFDVLIILYLLSITIVMLAGSGATFERWNISFMVGVLTCAVLVFFVILRGVTGILTINSWLIPMLVGSLLILSIYYILLNPDGIIGYPSSKEVWPSSIIYTALNITPLIAVLSTFGSQIKGKKDIFIAGMVSIAGLGSVAILLNSALMKAYQWMGIYEIPLFALLRVWPDGMGIGMSLFLWLAIFTTAVSGVYGIVHRIALNTKLSVWMIALGVLMLVIPLTGLGFRNLVSTLYPAFGILNLFLLALIILYPIQNIR